ncbi:hypothetical protein M427DRAFT_476567 [Gonapodya prolifera JEL478]|uniref:Uncharacterized protein n=1 Tax=Gonapodya prolifera (strain JEL478) TaxID=1344416 RepID=A0A139A1E8_GONPJ|nr:hypothetical protein M427DRAFT_476567 [Gonapodya prolifera JEL478]|eukprot:KXS10448.1 hypothetical protein M427DRAFT_476567 [Gonapodya prolifera JEL478]
MRRPKGREGGFPGAMRMDGRGRWPEERTEDATFKKSDRSSGTSEKRSQRGDSSRWKNDAWEEMQEAENPRQMRSASPDGSASPAGAFPRYKGRHPLPPKPEQSPQHGRLPKSDYLRVQEQAPQTSRSHGRPQVNDQVRLFRRTPLDCTQTFIWSISDSPHDQWKHASEHSIVSHRGRPAETVPSGHTDIRESRKSSSRKATPIDGARRER